MPLNTKGGEATQRLISYITPGRRVYIGYYPSTRKINSLIINPDVLTEKLIQKKSISNRLVYNEWIGEIDAELISHINENNYDFIVIDKWISNNNSNLKVNFLPLENKHSKKVISIVRFYEMIAHCSPVMHMNNHLHNADKPLLNKPSELFTFFKRITDISITLLTLPVTLPLALLGCIAVKLTSPGPVIFKQKRVGLNGRIFTLYKIRSMVHNPKGFNNHTVRNDNRITPVGKFLRKTKIDELPQLWNILNGDMSLIGPRPEKTDIVEQYSRENLFYKYRHVIKPGLTGWSQVNIPTATPEDSLEKLEYDLYYINNMSISLEMKILLKTLEVVSTMKGL